MREHFALDMYYYSRCLTCIFVVTVDVVNSIIVCYCRLPSPESFSCISIYLYVYKYIPCQRWEITAITILTVSLSPHRKKQQQPTKKFLSHFTPFFLCVCMYVWILTFVCLFAVCFSLYLLIITINQDLS